MPPQHGYHPQTFGPLVDILLLELTGMRVCEFWEQRIRRPLGLDFYIGLPESEFHRVAQLQAPRIQPGHMQKDEFYLEAFKQQLYNVAPHMIGSGPLMVGWALQILNYLSDKSDYD